MKDLERILAERLRQTRSDLGWSVEDVVSRLGQFEGGAISRSGFYNWETGQRTPSAKHVMMLGKVLGKDPAWLQGYSNNEASHVSPKYVTANSPTLQTKTGTIEVSQSCNDSALHLDYLEKRKLNRNKLLSIYQLDKSMSPLIAEGAEVLLDCERTSVRGTDLFGILVGGNIWIRRIREELDDTFTLSAANQAEYPEQKLTREELEKIEIIGRVARISVNL
ncbi:XRE family transcriptional regulator [Pseudomonas viridiflava]|uniref:XRE family transcriptional regulator n=1 Tax=Pseudomonas viridiflava TaxID=33069 RepID=UPI000F015C6A|nr:LexA family transcriptional regulator [Pseudomonas viridiflava]